MSIVKCQECELDYDTDHEVLCYGKCDRCFIHDLIKRDMAHEYFETLSQKEEGEEAGRE